MNFFDRFVSFISSSGQTPPAYGAFHLISLAVFILSTVLLCVWLSRADEKTFKRALTVIWVVLLIGEIYRELAFAFDTDGTTASYAYQWYLFPFQICSAPLYALPLIIFLPDGRIKNAVCAYMMTFSFFGGLSVMFYPGDVLCTIIGINYQSFLHHGLQVVIGLLLAIRMKKQLNVRFFGGALCVFAVVLALAMTLNISVHYILEALGRSDTFNMFYISPFHGCHIPILASIRDVAPYPVFLLSYFFGFSLVAAVMFWGQKLIIDLVNKRIEKKEKA